MLLAYRVTTPGNNTPMADQVQLVTYSSLTRSEGVRDTIVRVREALLHTLLRSVLTQVKVDEAWYCASYQDVADAIAGGELASGRDHYIAVGYFEGRFPRHIVVDAEWYLATYPDVAYALQLGRLDGAQEHFINEGFHEGRRPYEGWTL